jgi:thiosulfate dehydrogenase (quinone) large subunit
MSNVTDHSKVTEPVIRSDAGRKILAALRIVVGFNFLWSFLDKLLGLNYTTAPDSAWIEGGSPTQGYLMGASDGWLGPVWEAMAGSVVVDTVFMLALLGLGVAALTGAGLRIAAVAGVLLSIGFYLSQLPLAAGEATNPVTTSHWYYFLLFLLFPFVDAGRTWGVAGIWERTKLVRKNPWLR